MFECQALNSKHKDIVHHMAFELHGRRMATCSADNKVKIWDLGEDGQWRRSATMYVHSGVVWKVSWAHPEFGPIVATCSVDMSVNIWTERIGPPLRNRLMENVGKTPIKEGARRDKLPWTKTMTFWATAAVTDVAFGPGPGALYLAYCTVDGNVRVWEAPDVVDVARWTEHLKDFVWEKKCSCLSWSSRHPRSSYSMLAVGRDDTDRIKSTVALFAYIGGQQGWAMIQYVNSIIYPVYQMAFAPNMGCFYHLLAVVSDEVHLMQLKLRKVKEIETIWRKELIEKRKMKKELEKQEKIENEEMQKELALEIKTAEKLLSQIPKFTIGCLACFIHDKIKVNKISWNVLGTVLAVAGEDGYVRLYKANCINVWKCVGAMKGKTTLLPTRKIFFVDDSDSEPELEKKPENNWLSRIFKFWKK